MQHTIKHLFAFLYNDFHYHHNLFLIPIYGTESESVGCRKSDWVQMRDIYSCGQLG